MATPQGAPVAVTWPQGERIRNGHRKGTVMAREQDPKKQCQSSGKGSSHGHRTGCNGHTTRGKEP